MRLLCLLFFPALPASAQIFAEVSTTLGDFSVELYHEEAPKAVANFVTLAEGTRAWVDSGTGEVRTDTPYYEGIIFHRVIDGFMNQAGSQNGTGTDGPGYNLPDEVNNGLLHDEPYLLSAANSGPNTNGSQFFTTVVPTPWLDGIHTVFGKVVDGIDIIEAINNTPVNGSSPVTPVVIESIEIRRVGAEAEAFDEFGQGLPTITALEPVVALSPAGGQGVSLTVVQPPGSSLGVSRSGDLQTWAREFRYLDADATPLPRFPAGDLNGREFFRAHLIQWPTDAAFPDSLLGQTVTIDSNIGLFTLDLSEPGTLTLLQPGGSPIVATIDLARSTFEHDGYGGTWLLFSEGLVPFRFRFGADLPMAERLVGRVSGTAFNAAQTSITGTFSVQP